jgi:hypothetical protein
MGGSRRGKRGSALQTATYVLRNGFRAVCAEVLRTTSLEPCALSRMLRALSLAQTGTSLQIPMPSGELVE